jgi:hypothetical protein
MLSLPHSVAPYDQRNLGGNAITHAWCGEVKGVQTCAPFAFCSNAEQAGASFEQLVGSPTKTVQLCSFHFFLGDNKTNGKTGVSNLQLG